MGSLTENKSLLLILREEIAWIPPGEPTLEEIVESLLREIRSRDSDSLRWKLGGAVGELSHYYRCCLELNDVVSCMDFLYKLYEQFEWEELGWVKHRLRVYKVKDGCYLVLVTNLDEDNELVLRACLRADGEVRRKDFIDYVRKKLSESRYGRYYTSEDLKPLVSKLWTALAEKGVVAGV